MISEEARLIYLKFFPNTNRTYRKEVGMECSL